MVATNPTAGDQNISVGAAALAAEWVRLESKKQFEDAKLIRKDLIEKYGMDVGHSDEKPFYILNKR